MSYTDDGIQENYLTPPKKPLSSAGKPYSNSSNHILRQTLEARDQALKALDQLEEAQLLVVNVAALSPRPSNLPQPTDLFRTRIDAVQGNAEFGKDHSVRWSDILQSIGDAFNIGNLVSAAALATALAAYDVQVQASIETAINTSGAFQGQIQTLEDNLAASLVQINTLTGTVTTIQDLLDPLTGQVDSLLVQSAATQSQVSSLTGVVNTNQSGLDVVVATTGVLETQMAAVSAKATSNETAIIEAVNTSAGIQNNLSVVTTIASTNQTNISAIETNLTTLIAQKADAVSVYTKTQTDSFLADRALASNVYTKNQADTLFGFKADAASVYTKAETDAVVAAFVGTTQETLNSIGELASAIGNDENFAVTVSNQIGQKADIANSLAGYGILDAYTKSEVGVIIDGAIAAQSFGSIIHSDIVDFATAQHSHHLTDLLDFGADGGYLRSSGAGWVRSQGVAWADLTDVPAEIGSIGNKVDSNNAAFTSDVNINSAIPILWFNEEDSSKSGRIHLHNGYLVLAAESGSQVRFGSIDGNTADVRVLHDGTYHPIWHAGIDGSNSGMDADLLDGQEGAFYLDYDNLTNVPTPQVLDTSDDLPEGVTNLYFTNDRVTNLINAAYVNALNLNANSLGGQTGAYYLNYNNLTNKPTLQNLSNSNDLAEGSNNLYFTNARVTGLINKTYVDGLGVDAGTLNGVGAVGFLRSDADDTATGTLTISRIRVSAGSDASVTSTAHGFQVGSTASNNLIIDNDEIMARNNSEFATLQLNLNGGDVRANGHNIWTAGNDGSGSGLDADLLDGLHGSSYLSLGSATFNFRSSSANGYLHFSQGNTVHTGFLAIYNAAGTRKGYFGYADSSNIYLSAEDGTRFNFIGSNPTVGGASIWHGDNDGSGSGLDADLLDGLHAASFMRTTAVADLNMNFKSISNVSNVSVHAVQSRDKLRVWNSGHYAIGMSSGFSYGAINGYAMSFQMNLDHNRGFWWGASTHTGGQGAMSLSTNGNLTIAGNFTASAGTSYTSDMRLKEDWADLSDPFQYINKMSAKWFSWKKKVNGEDLFMGGLRDLGFSAQDMKEILPFVVRGEGNSMYGLEDVLSVDYGKLSVLAVAAAKELKAENEDLKSRLLKLEKHLGLA